MKLSDYKNRDEREVYGHDDRAINRHSVRRYSVPGHTPAIYLDKTLDGSPPFYELYDFSNGSLAVNIPVDGKRYWGDGLPWNQAVELAGEAIDKWFDEMNAA